MPLTDKNQLFQAGFRHSGALTMPLTDKKLPYFALTMP
jgi:hypothetical protein